MVQGEKGKGNKTRNNLREDNFPHSKSFHQLPTTRQKKNSFSLPENYKAFGTTPSQNENQQHIISQTVSKAQSKDITIGEDNEYIVMTQPVSSVTPSVLKQTYTSIRRVPFTWVIWFVQLIAVGLIISGLILSTENHAEKQVLFSHKGSSMAYHPHLIHISSN